MLLRAVISEIISLLISPLGLAILTLTLGSWVIYRYKISDLMTAICISSLLYLILGSLPYTRYLAFSLLESRLISKKDILTIYDLRRELPRFLIGDIYVVVLSENLWSSPILKSERSEKTALEEGCIPSGSTFKRLITTSEVYRLTRSNIIITGPEFRELSACKCYKKWLLHFGVPSEPMICAKPSYNTFQDAKRVRELIQDNLRRRTYLFIVTSAYHLPRSLLAFHLVFRDEEKVKLLGVPSDWKSKRCRGYECFFPDLDALLDNSVILREGVGWLFYRIFYGSGVLEI